ncbi:MAG: hypothetical protein WBM24_20160 [Candidatus Sulfotelmatobacter sp.]
MAIERTELSGSLNGNAMEPVASTPGPQNQAAPEPRRRESSAKKDSERGKSFPSTNGIDGEAIERVEKVEQAENAEQVVEEDRPPHRVDSLA